MDPTEIEKAMERVVEFPLGTIICRLNRAMSALQKELGGDFNE